MDESNNQASVAIICGGNGFEGISDDTILVEIVDSEDKHNILDEVEKEEIDEVSYHNEDLIDLESRLHPTEQDKDYRHDDDESENNRTSDSQLKEASRIPKIYPGRKNSRLKRGVKRKADDRLTSENEEDDIDPARNTLNNGIKLIKDEDDNDDQDVVPPFICPHCSKVYVREVTFKRHVAKCTANRAQKDDENMFVNWDDCDSYDCDDLFGATTAARDNNNSVNKARTRVVVTQDNCIDHAVEDGDETMAQRFLRHLLRDIRKSTRRSRFDF